MDSELQLKVQAYLDGELPLGEARQIEDRLGRDAQAQSLLAELKMTTSLLAGLDQDLKLPESREFFWSKIERDIQRHSRPIPPPASAWPWAFWRRWLASAGALAAILLVGLLAVRGPRGPLVEATLTDSGAFTYRDYSARTTLVWFSYPADNEIAEADPPDIFE
jgi:anti-sigma-K factor RskA